ncbi:MAG: TonB family protein [Litoreibacter sp.]|uniref:energy transducer TonB family protein n=1 Tax=Litoreibacter sp. TaxID=1969459 RepID=UPI00329785EA
MIATSRPFKFGALLIAAGVHIGASGAFAPDVTVEIEASAGAAQAKLGSSFADMSAGTISPTEVEDISEVIQPDTTPPPPKTQTTLTHTAPAPTQSTTPEINPLADPTALAVLTQKVAEALPTKPQTVTPATPVEKIISAAPDDPIATSPRPTRRDPKLVPKKSPKPAKIAEATPAARKAPKAKREKGKVNNTQGSATGSTQTRNKTQGRDSSRKRSNGNAAVSNYPGKIQRRIARVRKPYVKTRGSAVVSFTISSSGGLSKLSILRSSGSSQIDKAALQVVQNARPFPAPPKGAKRSYNVPIKIK